MWAHFIGLCCATSVDGVLGGGVLILRPALVRFVWNTIRAAVDRIEGGKRGGGGNRVDAGALGSTSGGKMPSATALVVPYEDEGGDQGGERAGDREESAAIATSPLFNGALCKFVYGQQYEWLAKLRQHRQTEQPRQQCERKADEGEGRLGAEESPDATSGEGLSGSGGCQVVGRGRVRRFAEITNVTRTEVQKQRPAGCLGEQGGQVGGGGEDGHLTMTTQGAVQHDTGSYLMGRLKSPRTGGDMTVSMAVGGGSGAAQSGEVDESSFTNVASGGGWDFPRQTVMMLKRHFDES